VSAPSRLIVVALVAGAAVLHGETQPPARQQPAQTFRAGTDLVMVDVSVRDDGRAVTGLRAEDFVLTDNGVRQRIESVEATAVPVDLTLVADLSGNSRGPWLPRTPAPRMIAEVQAEIDAVTRILRPDDRLRLLGVDRHVQLISPWSPVVSFAPVRHLEFDGVASLYDTLATALMQPAAPARRHIVIARTKGRDTMSALEAQSVRAIAERSDALFHLVVMETALDNETALSSFQCEFMGLCQPTRRFWVPFQRLLVGHGPAHRLTVDGQALAAAADSTGGALHKAAGLSEPTLTSTFKKAFEDFRSSYVLQYTLQGVPRGGWHTIEVKVPGSKSYSLRARKGYGVDEAGVPTRPAAIASEPRTLAELTAAYEAGAYRPVLLGIRATKDPERLIRDFEEAGNPWPATPRREAAFALELAEAGVFSSEADTRSRALELIGRFSRLIRNPIEPSVFERYWHFAALTLLEGTLQPAATEAFVARALDRFPDEPRFVLSRAIASDQQWAVSRSAPNGKISTPSPPDAGVVQRWYEAAIALPGTATEARIRLAWFLHRARRHEDALKHLVEAEDAPDTEPALRYLRQLFLGHVLGALGRHGEAVEAYRAAIVIAPAAQSARVALMNALLLGGDRLAAEAVAEQVQTEPDDQIDPWWTYWQGQYRLHPHAMARVRELIQ
jgi:VWFA-related protein